MNKKQFYKLLGKVEHGAGLENDDAQELFSFTEMLLGMMEQAMDDIDGDIWGTEGLDHAIGWD